MTTLSAPTAAPRPVDVVVDDRPPASAIVSDALTIAHRNLIALVRTPTTLVFSTIQPIIFVLLFRYVFGGAIPAPPHMTYVDYLMPGVFVQTVTFGSVNTGVGLATDLQTGIIERFRSLPMARSAVLAGRTLADAVRNLFVIILMVGMGFLVGFRVHSGLVPFLGAILLMLAFGFAMSWIMALIGLAAGNAEAAQAGAFPFMALLVFASNAFVSPSSMPRFLRDYANHEPVSQVNTAVRALTHGGATAEHVIVAAAWIVGITIVFAALAVYRYRRAV
jgi:ABC transporter DrrB family efflux protein